MPWLRRRKGGLAATVWIDASLIPELEAEATEHSPYETGGMLLGYRGANGDAVITAAIPAGPKAVRKRNRFEPDGEWQQGKLDEIYIRSGRITTYLGDWHSHPEGALRPSRRDRDTARAIAKTRAARAPQPLTLIAVTKGKSWRWAAFRFRGRRGFQKLKFETFTARADRSRLDASG